MNPMTSNKPYLIRATNEWILDNNCTPHLLVDADYPSTYVPREYVQKGQIILNISPSAVSKLFINNEVIEFDARFGGVLQHIYIPIEAVCAIYARENGNGMAFEADTGGNATGAQEPFAVAEENEQEDTPPKRPPKKGKPQLKIVE